MPLYVGYSKDVVERQKHHQRSNSSSDIINSSSQGAEWVEPVAQLAHQQVERYRLEMALESGLEDA